MCTGMETIALASLITTSTLAIKESTKSKASPLQLPEPVALPDPAAIKEQAKEDARRRAAGMTKTVLTGGAGIIDEPKTIGKTVLGG